MTLRYPVMVHHFVGKKKPNRDSVGYLDARFHRAYVEFFARYFPERLGDLAPAVSPEPVTARWLLRTGFHHLAARRPVAGRLARHPDPYDVIL